MFAEGIHSLVDTGNGGLLLLGIRRAKRPPNDQHPYGHGKALYFWTLIVAILIFGVGGGISIYEGILHALHAGPLTNPTYTIAGISLSGLTINYIVLGLAIVFESGAWLTAWKAFQKAKGDKPTWRAIRESKDPTTFTVLFEDSAALAGLVVALIGITLGHVLEMPALDGLASVAIGLILCGVALVLIWESKGLLLGESVEESTRESIRQVLSEDPDIERLVRMMTMHMGPEAVILNLDLAFPGALSGEEVEAAVDRVEKEIRGRHPEVKHIFIEAESLAAHRRKRASEPPAPPGDQR